MSLSKILEEMKKVRPMAEEDVDSGPVETLSGRRGRQKRAVESLKDLRREYSDHLLRTAVFIVSVGSDREAFEKVASTDGNCLFSEAESFFNDLSNRIHPTLYAGKDPGSNLFDVVGRHLEDKARELGITEYPQLLFKAQYRRMVNGPADFADLLKLAITEQVGGEVVGINAARTLTDAAIEKGHSASYTPILVSTPDQKFSVDLIPHLERLTPRVFLVVAGKAPKALKSMQGAILVKDASLESVEAALTQIKNSLKK